MSSTSYLGNPPNPQHLAFHAQAPQPSYPAPDLHSASSSTLQRRTPTTSSSPPPASQLHATFTQTDQIRTKRDNGPWQYRIGEAQDLLNGYGYALRLQGRQDQSGMEFRDALLDALAEYLDEYGLEGFPWGLFEGLAERACAWRLRHLVALYAALTVYPGCYEEAGLTCCADGFETAFWDEVVILWAEQWAKGRSGARIWYRFMRDGRCRFHEHAIPGNVCWR